MVGTGAYDSVPQACEATLRVTEEILPRPAWQQFYDALYAEYRQVYPALRERFHQLTRLAERTA